MRTRMKIWRDGKIVGEVLLATAELVADDAELAVLWSRWQADGFAVLGPPPENPQPQPGGSGFVCAVAQLIIRPAADNLGLVAIQLEGEGYNLTFE